jgi:hypothetical protein
VEWHPVAFRSAGFYLAAVLAPGIVIVCVFGDGKRKRRPMRLVFLAMLALLTLAFLSCSGVSKGTGGGGGGGGSGSCSSAPDVPAEPTATFNATTGSPTVTATLDWQAPAASSACTITEYLVYENGASTPVDIAIPTYAPQLAPGSYAFTVAAQDSFGTSAASDPLDFGIYQITVTGNSPGTAPDSGQSAQVFLVVD